MPFDGLFLHHLLNEIKVIKNGKINKIYQINEYEFIFQVRNNHQSYQLLISMHPEQYRIQLTDINYDKPENPSNLTMFLRKHLEGGIIKDIIQIGNDRIVKIMIYSQNELKDLVSKELIVELMGRYNNLILTIDEKIIQAYKYIFNLETNSRVIALNAKYLPPEQKKENPFSLDISIENYRNIQGICKEALFELENNNLTLSDLKEKIDPVIYKLDNKYAFYFLKLPSIKKEFIEFNSLNELLDNFYKLSENKIKSNQKANNMFHFLKRNIEKNTLKLEKLKADLFDSENSEIYKKYGDLLFFDAKALNNHENEVFIKDYESEELIKIPLDISKTIKENALLYYKKYKKKKNSIIHINEQIEKTLNEIDYFTLLLDQLNIATLNDLNEIYEELAENNYLRSHEKNKKKKKKPNILTFIDPNGIEILVGKNNIQNDYITNKIARPNDTWMHVSNSPSSHVLIRSEDELLESTIRLSANLAAYYSKYRYSSSVMVNYTKKKNLRKVKGKANSFVTYTAYKSIYIDPDETLVNSLIKKN